VEVIHEMANFNAQYFKNFLCHPAVLLFAHLLVCINNERFGCKIETPDRNRVIGEGMEVGG